MSASSTAALVRATARRYGLGQDFYDTLLCESQGFKNIQSQIPDGRGPGGFEDSWGVAQIHLPAHPEISRKEALDVRFAVDWAAQAFASGNARWWTCWAKTGRIAAK